MRQGAAEDDEAGPPGAVHVAVKGSPPQSSEQVTVSVSPGLKSARYSCSAVLFFQFSATVACSRPLFVLVHRNIALPAVLLI